MDSLSEQFAARLLVWQREHGRHDLPWQVSDPYRVWLSEVMLQQTQVRSVLAYYPRFLAEFPDVATLAQASLDAVLAQWSGLGYYSRARNLHRAAQQIMAQHQGVFPTQFEDILALPGVGRSTAAAISAFAFAQRRAILDGNVKRVLCRAFGVEGWSGDKHVEQRLWALSESLLPPSPTEMATYTQGLMDLGSLCCTRSRPACERCPFTADCVAQTSGRTRELPFPRPKKVQPTRSTLMVWFQHEGQMLLMRRPSSGIWGGLWSFPELNCSGEVAALAEKLHCTQYEILPTLPEFEHVFTHFRLVITPQPVVVGHIAKSTALADDFVWASPDAALRLGLPAPVRRLIEQATGQIF